MRAGKGRWRLLVLCCVLEVGALAGVPMRPDDVEKLMQAIARPRIVQVRTDETDGGGDGGDPRPRR